MNPSPCLTAGSNQNVVTPAGWFGECCKECVGREERKVFGGKSFLSSLAAFQKSWGRRCASRRRLRGVVHLSSLQTRLFKFKSMVINNANK